MPFVESKYRVDTARRTLIGHSYGGLFVGFALTMDRPSRHYFANFIALDGSFWQQPDLMASGNQALFDAYNGVLPAVKVVLSSTTQGNAFYVQSYFDALSAFRFAGLDVILIPPYTTSHLSMFDQGFKDSVEQIMPIPQ